MSKSTHASYQTMDGIFRNQVIWRLAYCRVCCLIDAMSSSGSLLSELHNSGDVGGASGMVSRAKPEGRNTRGGRAPFQEKVRKEVGQFPITDRLKQNFRSIFFYEHFMEAGPA